MWVGWPDRLVLVEVGLLEVAELGLQVLEVLSDALILLSQPHVGLRILLLMLRIALLQHRHTMLLLNANTGHFCLCFTVDLQQIGPSSSCAGTARSADTSSRKVRTSCCLIVAQ